MNIEEQITERVEDSLQQFTPQLREWVESHVIRPRSVAISKDPDGKEYSNIWLVTDHTGNNDSSYRVVYDQGKKSFGLEVTLKNGISWFMGNYGEFTKAVEAM